jgi:hypothetical protein
MPHPSKKGRPIVTRVRFSGNKFTQSLPSNGFVRHNILFYIYSLVVTVLSLFNYTVIGLC